MWPAFLSSSQTLSRRDLALAGRIVRLAESLQAATDRELCNRATDVRFEIATGERPRRAVTKLFPLIVEAARRHLGMRHYQVQVAAGFVLCRGAVAEMQTGEGKTLAATLPLTFHAMTGKATHLATANDYLAQRDAEWMRPVYEAVGLSVGSISAQSSFDERRAAYACDITYSTAREFGFDFLRDRINAANETTQQSVFHQTVNELIAYSGRSSQTAVESPPTQQARLKSKVVQRQPFGFVLVDEADSLLIDEARTPLIISSEIADQATHEVAINWCSTNARQFVPVEHFARDPKAERFEFTRGGYRLLRSIAKPTPLNSVSLSEIADAMLRAIYVEQSLRRDEHYVVVDDEIKIVDEYTGRIADGRKWRNGIHQAVEIREQVPMTPLTIHAAKITLPEYLGYYENMSGMTGTAVSAAAEFRSVYHLPVVKIPTNKKSRRATWPARVFRTSDERWHAVAAEVAEQHAKHRPVLIGTRTVEQSERVSKILREQNLPHEILNALNHATEAEIVSRAGHADRTTVATNMAGRGTDIKLAIDVERIGGLHVICSEPHSSARIDRQLAGRCARQGDLGSVRQFMSLEDEVLREACGPDEIAEQVRRLSSASPNHQMRAIVKAQAKVERRHAQERRLLLHYSQMQIAQHEQLGEDPWLAIS